MLRVGRVVLPDYPHHVVRRGHNRQVVFAQDEDYVIPPGEWELIREAVKRGQLTGNTRFAEAVEQIIGRRIERRGPGRPLKNEPEG